MHQHQFLNQIGVKEEKTEEQALSFGAKATKEVEKVEDQELQEAEKTLEEMAKADAETSTTLTVPDFFKVKDLDQPAEPKIHSQEHKQTAQVLAGGDSSYPSRQETTPGKSYDSPSGEMEKPTKKKKKDDDDDSEGKNPGPGNPPPAAGQVGSKRKGDQMIKPARKLQKGDTSSQEVDLDSIEDVAEMQAKIRPQEESEDEPLEESEGEPLEEQKGEQLEEQEGEGEGEVEFSASPAPPNQGDLFPAIFQHGLTGQTDAAKKITAKKDDEKEDDEKEDVEKEDDEKKGADVDEQQQQDAAKKEAKADKEE